MINEFLLALYVAANKVLFPRFAQVSTDIFLKQMRLETAHYKSKSFTVDKNVAGLKVPVHRKTTAAGQGQYDHARFNTYYDSVRDLFLRNDYFAKKKGIKAITSDSEYLQFLKDTGYAEAPNYIQVIQQMRLPKSYGYIIPVLVLGFFLPFISSING